MKLISMTEFILQQNEIRKQYEYPFEVNDKTIEFAKVVLKYAKFLRQPLSLGMFVPVDEDGNVLEEPKRWQDYLEAPESFDGNSEWHEFYKYEIAQEKVLFEGVKTIIKENFFFIEEKDGSWLRVLKKDTVAIVEDLLKISGVELTPSALKQIGL
ncbi:hypothetical protein [Chryseobacterium gallinarum]|uniref:Uncharacterized protein n=1 Tax=Chryseobacterium gallinarum TaxID=1324352 RepID=A0ABX6KUE1_CHRGL|nr:hypothetical protein [Chryseobacterium gallinarum]QIY92219.1 hypothetical protein FOB44_16805 [Chryseobacterium gallinarum]